MTEEIDRGISRKFLQACQNGDLAKVKLFVDEYCIRNWTVYRHSTTGDTALHVSSREGHIDVVKYLCENWTLPEYKANVTNFDMKRPLHEAAQFARNHVLEYLMEQGVDVDPLKRGDWTPLMLACTKSNAEAQQCISKLLQCGAMLSLRNKDGWTPFLIACREGDPVIVEQLLKHSPECINDISNNKRTPLHIAAFHGCQNVLNMLLTAKPDLLESRDSAGSTPLHESVKSLNFNAADYLLKRGANVKALDNMGQNILHTAASVGNTEIIEYLLSKNAIRVDAEAQFGITPLQIAKKNKQIRAIEILSRKRD